MSAREMVTGDILLGPVEEAAVKAVAAIFADLRGRRFLEYLFDDEPGNRAAYGYIDTPFDLDVQRDIASAWQKIIASSFAALSVTKGE